MCVCTRRHGSPSARPVRRDENENAAHVMVLLNESCVDMFLRGGMPVAGSICRRTSLPHFVTVMRSLMWRGGPVWDWLNQGAQIIPYEGANGSIIKVNMKSYFILN